MKKIIACLPLLLIAFASCDKKDENATFHNDLKFYNLNGDVKSVQERSYEIVGGDAVGNLKRENSATYDTDLEFDKNKQLIAEKSYRSNGKLYWSKTFEFKDRLLTHDEYLPDNVVYKTKYTFVGDNNTIVSKRDREGRQIHRTVNTFEKGLLTQKRIFDNNDQLIERYTYVYDKQGNALQVAKHTEYETLYTDVYAYDNKRNKVSDARLDKLGKQAYKNVMTYKDSLLTSAIGLNAEGIEVSIEKRSYDKKGNLLNKSFEDLENKMSSKELYHYDAKGNLIEWILFEGSNKIQTISYDYDGHKNLTGLRRISNDGTVQENKKYIYEYDDQGNWIRKNIINNDMPVFVLERKIEYY